MTWRVCAGYGVVVNWLLGQRAAVFCFSAICLPDDDHHKMCVSCISEVSRVHTSRMLCTGICCVEHVFGLYFRCTLRLQSLCRLLFPACPPSPWICMKQNQMRYDTSGGRRRAPSLPQGLLPVPTDVEFLHILTNTDMPASVWCRMCTADVLPSQHHQSTLVRTYTCVLQEGRDSSGWASNSATMQNCFTATSRRVSALPPDLGHVVAGPKTSLLEQVALGPPPPPSVRIILDCRLTVLSVSHIDTPGQSFSVALYCSAVANGQRAALEAVGAYESFNPQLQWDGAEFDEIQSNWNRHVCGR